MALISLSNLTTIAGWCILSRLVVICLQLLFNLTIPDHTPDAYKNRYYSALEQASKTEIPVTDSYSYYLLYKSIEGLTKWDGQYFLEVSVDGYTSEKHLAFLPMYPTTVALTKNSIFDQGDLDFDFLLSKSRHIVEGRSLNALRIENYIKSALVGIALNNFIFFPIAGLSLYVLTRTVKQADDIYAKKVVKWFCINPASIFFSACYTESLFSALTFTSMLMIEYRVDNYISRASKDDGRNTSEQSKSSDSIGYLPLRQQGRLIYTCLPSMIFLILASATRSNGLVTIGFIGYQLLLKYAPWTKLNGYAWSIMMKIMMFCEIIQDALGLLILSIVAASGYIAVQVYSYTKFCKDDQTAPKGFLNIKPEWCDLTIPHPYSHVQRKYWNVGFLRYHELKQLPNFILALPITCLVLFGSLKANLGKMNERRRLLVYYVHAILLVTFCGFFINVQVTTRLLASSCPVVYWITADIASASRSNRRFLLSYFLSYYILGIALHSNFYPWT